MPQEADRVAALAAAMLFGQSNDVYFKVGLLTTIGLAAKNAILIVEFAIDQQKAGKELVAAALEASRQRLRPILMTSLAFILGVLPPAIAQGPGSGSQNSIGIGVMGGMISATVLGVLFIPLLFVTTRKLFNPSRKADYVDEQPAHAATDRCPGLSAICFQDKFFALVHSPAAPRRPH